MPAMTRGLPWTRPSMNCGKVFWFTRPVSTSTNATVAFLSASGNAANTGSMAPEPRSFSFAIDFCVAGLAGSVAALISVTSRSARKFVKKLIQPFRWGPAKGHVSRTYPAAPSRSKQVKVSGAAQIQKRAGIAAGVSALLARAVLRAAGGLCHSLWLGQTFGQRDHCTADPSVQEGQYNPLPHF